MDTYNSSNKNHSDSNKLFSRTKMSARSQGADRRRVRLLRPGAFLRTHVPQF